MLSNQCVGIGTTTHWLLNVEVSRSQNSNWKMKIILLSMCMVYHNELIKFEDH